MVTTKYQIQWMLFVETVIPCVREGCCKKEGCAKIV